MKKNSILFILFIIINTTSLFSQKEYSKKYYGDAVLKEEGWVDNGNKTGYWTFYHENGVIKKQGHFKNNYPIKYWYFYHKNGSPEKEGHFVNGKQNKWWLFYDKNGSINHKCQLIDNQKNGYCLVYKEERLVKALRFSNDEKVKEWTDFSSFRKENDLKDLK